ncbi:HET-domain-containing protein [Decorospora gaudefroyi]|uniref:HET-domain-containing protein n=1 Tax=Decorospora gaudefroyi TaxID=184978 RepID=A0A6A5KM90_9PLEO|nr:HET-domain-containing protein [Decorospora gaudefroyi]
MPRPLSYTQRILSGRTFRLLHIVPARDQNEQLECYCLPYNIDEAPSYEALSYVWGNPDPPTELLCNGQSIQIGPSLSQALRRLRCQETARIVWADAICINQEDEAEKSHQVPMMGRIYSSARRVVVWLGHGDAHQTQPSFGCSRNIANACYLSDQRHGIVSDHSARHEEVNIPESLFDPLILSSLQELYERPWFSRIWCIQEIRLASNAQVIWGDAEMSWSDLAVSASWIFDKMSLLEEDDRDDPVASLVKEIPVQNADMMRDKERYHLLEALDHFRGGFQASNPKDKVYGLLSLVSPRIEVDALNVNYNKSVGEVYADTALVVIQLYSRLTAFAHVTHPPDYDGPGPGDYEKHEDYNGFSEYRSWAPRWDDIAVAEKLGVPEDDCPWSACGEHVEAVAVTNPCEPRQLCLKGVVYDKVYEVGDIMDYYNLKDPKHADDYEHDDVSIPDAEDIYAISDPSETHPFIKAFESTDGKLSLERFARTLTTGRWDLGNSYVQHLDNDTQSRHRDACLRSLDRLTQLQFIDDESVYAHDYDSARFERDAYDACKQRRTCWTEKGSYGLGPHCMRTGDIIVVLYGGNTPYVLRPRGAEYIFMGQAYVDEIMHGELFQGSATEVPQEQTFCLL